ncbi:MAG: NAD-dependent epimerase/dehydratase family protein [Elusimicrobiota bacterium]|nr:NAD-dependent epimerase/dehydratase family protein [Elusimicrobiota bacterium]
MKVLVTGANGFIGSHIVEEFVKYGDTVRCLVHKNLTWIKNLPVEIYRGSITQPDTLLDAVKDIDFVFHSAAVLRVINTEDYYRINHLGTKNLIETIYRTNPNIKRFVYISTQSAMGPLESYKPTELKDVRSICKPVSEYGRSKLLGEEEVIKFKDKLPVTILRPSAVYGPRDQDLLPFFKCISYGFFPVLTGRNECFVQLLFVKDLSQICYLITQRSKLDSTVYFLSEKKPYTWEEIANMISQVANKKIKIIRLPIGLVNLIASISEVFMKYFKDKPAKLNRDKVKEFCQKYWLADQSQSEKEFNFKFTELEIGIKITYNWYKENKWL